VKKPKKSAAKQAVLNAQIAESLQDMQRIEATVYESDHEYVSGWLGTLEDLCKWSPPAYKTILLKKIAEVRESVTDGNVEGIRRAVELADMFHRPMFETAFAEKASNLNKSRDFEARRNAMHTAYVEAGRPKREPWCRAHCKDFGFNSWRRAYDLLAGI